MLTIVYLVSNQWGCSHWTSRLLEVVLNRGGFVLKGIILSGIQVNRMLLNYLILIIVANFSSEFLWSLGNNLDKCVISNVCCILVIKEFQFQFKENSLIYLSQEGIILINFPCIYNNLYSVYNSFSLHTDPTLLIKHTLAAIKSFSCSSHSSGWQQISFIVVLLFKSSTFIFSIDKIENEERQLETIDDEHLNYN